MFLGTENSFLAFRIHFGDFFGLGAATVGARGVNSGCKGATFLSSKITIWGSTPMFLGTGNSLLASRIHFDDYFGLGVATVGARGGKFSFL